MTLPPQRRRSLQKLGEIPPEIRAKTEEIREQKAREKKPRRGSSGKKGGGGRRRAASLDSFSAVRGEGGNEQPKIMMRRKKRTREPPAETPWENVKMHIRRGTMTCLAKKDLRP